MIDIIKKSIKDLNGFWSITLLASLPLSLLPSIVMYHKTLGLFLILVFTGVLKKGFSKTVLNIVKKEPVKINNVLDVFSYFKNTLGVFLLSMIFIGVGLVLFIIPGIIIAIWLSQSFFILVENPSLEPMEIFKRSRDLVKGKELKYFSIFALFIVVSLLLVIFKLSFLALLLAPIQYVVFANFYLTLKES